MKHNTTHKKSANKKKKTATKKNTISNQLFTEQDYNSNDGMMTSIWGPTMA